MADINVYFFWPGLIVSIVLSILLSVLLTIGLNFRRRNKEFSNDSVDSEYAYESSEPDWEGGSSAKTGGMILVGPIPIVFGNSGFRFDKSVFKYALVFFLTVLIVWFILTRAVRL